LAESDGSQAHHLTLQAEMEPTLRAEPDLTIAMAPSGKWKDAADVLFLEFPNKPTTARSCPSCLTTNKGDSPVAPTLNKEPIPNLPPNRQPFPSPQSSGKVHESSLSQGSILN
jgi:hypothetical protein